MRKKYFSHIEMKAAKVYGDQKNRCYNDKDPRYPTVGGRGIKIRYSKEDFVKWYAETFEKKGLSGRVTCIRLDRDKDYILSNIDLSCGGKYAPKKKGGALPCCPVGKRAYKSWKGQRSRCYNKNDKRYEFYGAKGIEVTYGSKDFVRWYMGEYAKRKNWKRPTVDRLDHDKDYCFGNIRLVECSENTEERNKRIGNPFSYMPRDSRGVCMKV